MSRQDVYVLEQDAVGEERAIDRFRVIADKFDREQWELWEECKESKNLPEPVQYSR